MYKIIGGDEGEYGPVTAQQIRQWIAEGRAGAETKVQAEGSSDWKPLSSFPEFRDLLGSFSGAAAVASAIPVSSAIPPSVPTKTSGMAIASLVLGILGFCGITAVAGLILGIAGLNQINRSNGRLGGKGMAITGICISSIMLLLSICFIPAGMLFPMTNRVHEKARRAMCLNNLKQIGLAIKLYAADNHDKYPTDAAWTTLGSYGLLMPNYQPSYKIWVCTSDTGIVPGSPFVPLTAKNVSYAYNGFGLTENVQPDTPIIADRTSGDIHSPIPWAGNTWTHKRDGGNVLCADGHVAFLKTLQPPMYNGRNP